MKKIFLPFLLSFLISGFLSAQSAGKLAGKVTDQSTGEPLIGVNILVVGTTLGAATNIDGNYVILNISPGKYTVRVQYIGYQTIVMENVPISVDLTTTRNFDLASAAVELGEIVVEGAAERVQKDITSSQARVSAESIAALPVSELTDVLELQAGVTRDAGGGFHIRGGRTQEVAYTVNGMSITDSYDNSQGLQLDNSSVQELQVISGTFNAEYGNAMSGIINTVTKEGGTQFNGNIVLYAGDHLSNFTEYFTYIDDLDPLANYNMQGSLSGPIPYTNDKLRFFGMARYDYDDGYLYGIRKYTPTGEAGDNEYVPMNWRKNYFSQGKLTYWASKSFKFTGEVLWSRSEFQDYNHAFKWNPDGDVNKFTNSFNGIFTFTHMLDERNFYTINSSYFFRDFYEYLYRDDWSRYMHGDSLQTISNAFLTMGTNLHRFNRETNTIDTKIDFTSQITNNHLVKIGVEGKYHKLDLDDYNLEPLRINGVEVTPFVPAVPGEDQLGRNKFNREPIEFAGYIQDKIEYESVIINIGLRLDYFNSRGDVLVDPSDPNIYTPLREELKGLSLAEREPYFYKDATAKWAFSPRFGIAYPISESGVLHFSYGHFLQIPSFQYLYDRGRYKVPQSGSTGSVYGNPDLKPQKTVMYELGFRQELTGQFFADATVFYRDIRNWISSSPKITTKNLVTYSIYTNKDYSNVKGITLTLSKQYNNYYSIDLNYTYQVAEGSNSTPEDEYNAQNSSNEPTLYLLPMDWDQRHLLNLSVYVGAPDMGASFIARYGTGLPYTPSTNQYTADRGITSGFQKNTRRRPDQFSIDMKLHKEFELFGYSLTTFLRVYNLLDTKIAVNVFGDTGAPDYTLDPAVEDPNRPNTVAEYRKYPTNYGEPRKFEFGFDFSF